MTVAEFWTVSCGFGVEDKKTLGDKLRETLDENKELQQKVNRLEHSLTYTALKNMEANIEDLQTRLNNSRASNEAYRSMNSVLSRRHASTMHQTQDLKMQLEAMKKENESLHNVIDSFVDKCKKLEDKVKEHENALKDTHECYENALVVLKNEHERLDKSIADRSELQADRDIWFRKNGEKQAEIEELNRKANSLAKELEDAKKQLAYFTGSRDEWRGRAKHAEKKLEEIKQDYSEGYSDGNEEGQNELWEMLQLINDVKPFEAPYFEDVTSMNDIISWDLEDFKEAYDKWEEEQRKVAEEAKKQHTEYMRDYLTRFCIGRLCFNCPLYNASEPVSSCVFSKLTDEEVEKRYRKVIENDCKKIPVPVSARLPQPWECTIEAKVEINEDILKVVCGIKDDKK